uniref:Putative inactive n=1 Tax=Schistocerca gregaria TaxID=7010 RepID=A0A6B9FDR5_SCHGR|nr:putative inactive [Schistocerca gregaria]
MGSSASRCCGGSGDAATNDGSVLDRVISQASGCDGCLLYRLADYKKGGELVDAYNVGGQAEVEKLIREQFGVLMYGEGRGQVINRAEYLRWKFRDQKEVVLPIEASLSAHDPLARWEDHEACWQMQYRGSLGETLLHVLIICDTRLHTRLARTLIKCFPKLALDVVEGEDYLGASGLHLAIAYNNNELVQDLVEAGASVSQRAIGSFFLPRDQQRPRPARHTDYEGLAYLGEFPLAWAACCANESVYNLLLDHGADPDAQDSFGNMILHMVVVCDKLDMFGYALRHPKLPACNGIANRAGLTPLTLACKLGRAEVFREMLELSAREFWRYSNITCSAYPLNALDTLLPDGRTNWNSALFIILNGTKEAHLDMLDGGIIQRLLEEKWKTFARMQFLKRLAILALHLLFLSTAIYLRPKDHDEPLLGPTDWGSVARYCAELATVGGVLSYVILQQGEEIKNQGLLSFLKQLSHAPDKAIFLASNLMILACIPLRVMGDKRTEEAILQFAVPGSWFLLMFFAGAIRLTGPFVTMVYSMITGDMLTFGIIYTVVLFGFSQSFYFLYKGFPGVKTSLYHSYPTTWMALFQITLGDYNYPELSHTTYPTLAKTVFAIFMVLVPILLLNMLIAMMGNTYAHVIEQSEKEWMKQWAKIVVSLERAVNQAAAHQYLQEYSISLGPSDDPSQEQRGVMVIKTKSKTRARQRKGAVMNWKRVGKVTIRELKKRNMTGDQLRRLMWERASISTPIRVPDTPDPAEVEAAMDSQGNALKEALEVIAFQHDLDLDLSGGPPSTPGSAPSLAPAPAAQAPPVAPTAPAVPPAFGRALGVVAPLSSPAAGAAAAGAAAPPPATALPAAASIVSSAAAAAAAFAPAANAVQTPPIGWVIPPPHRSSSVDAPPPWEGDAMQQLVALSEVLPSDDPQLAVIAQLAYQQQLDAQMVPPAEQHRYCCARRLHALEAANASAPSLEPSDSDEFGDGGAMLGRGSRARRARSARWRPPTSASNGGARRMLFQHHGRSSTSSSSGSGTGLGIINPAFIADNLQMSPPARAPERAAETPPPPAAAQPPLPNAHGAVGRFSIDRDKTAARPRPKTARVNRVAPAAATPSRRGTSAQAAPVSQSVAAEQRRLEEAPDPLDAWSTRSIANMNTLLAWDRQEDESL